MNRTLLVVLLGLLISTALISAAAASRPVVYTPGVTPGTTAKWELNDYYDASYLQMTVLNVSTAVVTTKITVTEANNTQVSGVVGLSVSNLSVAMVPVVDTITAKITTWNGNNGEMQVKSTGFVNSTGVIQIIAGNTNAQTALASGQSGVIVTTYIPSVNTNDIGINSVIYYRSCTPNFPSVPTDEIHCSNITLSSKAGMFPLALDANTTLTADVISNIPVLSYKIGPISLPPILISGNLSGMDQLALNVPISVSNAVVSVIFGHVRNIIGVTFPTPEGTITGKWDQQTGLLTSYVDDETAVSSLTLVSTNAFNGAKASLYADVILAWTDIWYVIGGAGAGYFWAGVAIYVIGFVMMTSWDATVTLRQKTILRIIIVVMGAVLIMGAFLMGGVI